MNPLSTTEGILPASTVRRRPLWHAGARGPGRCSKRFSGQAFRWKVAPSTSPRFSFRETVAGLFGCAVMRSNAKCYAPVSVAIAGVLEGDISVLNNICFSFKISLKFSNLWIFVPPAGEKRL